MSNALLEGIKKWLNHIKAPNGYSIRLYLQSHISHYTDASKLGFGDHSPLYIYIKITKLGFGGHSPLYMYIKITKRFSNPRKEGTPRDATKLGFGGHSPLYIYIKVNDLQILTYWHHMECLLFSNLRIFRYLSSCVNGFLVHHSIYLFTIYIYIIYIYNILNIQW